MKIMVVGKGLASRNLMRSIEEVSAESLVLWISSGEEAVNAYRILEPDLIFMDIVQDGMSGIESARSIREQNKTIKIVLVSQDFNQEFLVAARETGMNGYLIRTYDPDTLRRVLQETEEDKFVLFSR